MARRPEHAGTMLIRAELGSPTTANRSCCRLLSAAWDPEAVESRKLSLVTIGWLRSMLHSRPPDLLVLDYFILCLVDHCHRDFK